jgi:hypothetical protein
MADARRVHRGEPGGELHADLWRTAASALVSRRSLAKSISFKSTSTCGSFSATDRFTTTCSAA